MPTISVIIPAYNAEHTILETIKSVQQQTFSDFEIIIINDGSTDRTLEILNAIADSRIKIFSYENGGLPVARNRGIARATGEFLAFLDADDLWTPDKLELQLAALQQHPEAGVAYSWTHFMDEQGKSFHADEPIYFEGNVYANLLLKNFLASGSNPLIRKQAIESVGEFYPPAGGSADWDYWVRLAERWHFVVIPKPQIFYRQSSSSMSSKMEFMEKCKLIVLERAFQAAPPEFQSLKNQSLANTYQYSAHLCLTRVPGIDGVKQAGQKLMMAIQAHPQTLLDKKTQKLLLKFLLKRIVSPKIANNFLQEISKINATAIRGSHDEKASIS
ncbi:glycosyl transferase family A [Scytonema hofmannii PCC 7110]|uniref:Glycosyl transferase family A n=1 Tax=Scytonema hofmannii PCC 7110 TaxID=128403 RepID=A0A139X7B5_9CYAN|nr:glycosyltransferase family A protein [Scytonema hofmannii]KYC40591.1 glycosyl transferase family A [Scytonema hofmannii PCC 7110]